MTPLAWAALLVGVPVVGFVAFKVVAAIDAPTAPAALPAATSAPATMTTATAPAPASTPTGPILNSSGQTACQALTASLVAKGDLAGAREIAAICPGAVVPS